MAHGKCGKVVCDWTGDIKTAAWFCCESSGCASNG